MKKSFAAKLYPAYLQIIINFTFYRTFVGLLNCVSGSIAFFCQHRRLRFVYMGEDKWNQTIHSNLFARPVETIE